MFVPMRNYGKFGFINDTPASMLPIGAWNRARNVRFKGNYITRVQEPDLVSESDSEFPDVMDGFPDEVLWGQQFFDGTIVRFVVATATELWVVNNAADGWDNATRASGNYITPAGGYWQSFPWGNTVVFNNGVDIPQVFDTDAGVFIDMPQWGMITGSDGTTPFDTRVKCRFLVPYKSFLVACNLTSMSEGGSLDDTVEPNTIWWSDGFQSPDLWKDQGMVWDYAVNTNLSAQNQIGLEEGPLQWAATLGEALVLYNSSSATQMLFTGGSFVFDFRRLFDYGCVGLYGAAEFLNQHYVVASDVHYIHDGNKITQVAEDRVRDWFYNIVRNLESTVRVAVDYTNREVLVQMDVNPDELVTNAPDPNRLALTYNYDDNNYTVIDATVDRDNQLYRVNCMVYGLDLQRASEVSPTWDLSELQWDEYGTRVWDSLQGSSTSASIRQSMFWVTPYGLYRANQLSTPSPNKTYMVRKTHMDLDEIDPKLTTNLWKHIRQVYPHITGKGEMQMRLGWSPNLEIDPTWGPYIPFVMRDEATDPENDDPADVKIDCRTTGRYLAIEYVFNDCLSMRFSGVDMDVLPVYGR